MNTISQQMIELPIELMNNSGVYLLYLDDSLQYIGSSHCGMSRVCTHKYINKKKFNKVYFLRVDLKEIRMVEKALTSILQPPLNSKQEKRTKISNEDVRKVILKYNINIK